MTKRFIALLLSAALLPMSSLTQAGLFDRKDDAVDLILNQKDCIYMKTYRGKMIKGDFIRPDRWTGSKRVIYQCQQYWRRQRCQGLCV
ncbi:MAG: hypothetical protein RL614_232 [Pseudomonadota bacterium]